MQSERTPPIGSNDGFKESFPEIFYGGNNESIQYLQYDTRPSYPYNYFMINDISKLNSFTFDKKYAESEIDSSKSF